MLLSDVDIRKLIEEEGFIENYTDLEVQLQQCGFDLTLDYVERPMYKSGIKMTVIDFDNSQRHLTKMERMAPHSIDGREWFILPPGDYTFLTMERVRIPANVGAILRVRSSLHRPSLSFTSSCIDPGYYGRLTASLHIPAPGLRIMYGARFCQMLSWYLSSPAERLYDGIYKEEDNGKKA